MRKKTIAVIPARIGSTRFPAKVIAPLDGKPIIQWVYEKAKASKADEVYVATDDQRIVDIIHDCGGKAIMTDPNHYSGTDRIWEVIAARDGDIILNVQGDEPLVPVSVIDELIDTMLNDEKIEMSTVAVPAPQSVIEKNPNIVKVVFDNKQFALYFSRSFIPFHRSDGKKTQAYRHWGIYAYRRDILQRFVSLPKGRLEEAEGLEQLRAMENGISIYVHLSQLESIGIDTPEDLKVAEKVLQDLKSS